MASYDHAITNGAETKHDLTSREDPGEALQKIRTAGSISISPELFEKIYLSPEGRVHGDLRRTFGNPTPIALGGFLLALSPLTNELLNWRGSGVLGEATTGNYFFFGGLTMVLGGTLEFFLGNTFPSVVFTMFGAFWLSYGATLVPYFNAAIAYDPTHPAQAAKDPQFATSFAFFMIYMSVLCFIFLICALRTNLVFVFIFALLVPAFACLASAFWNAAEGYADYALKLQHAGAGLAYAVCILGWYLFTVQMLAAVDFPIDLPVIDLSHIVKGGSEIKKNKERRRNEQADPEQQRGRGMKFWKKK